MVVGVIFSGGGGGGWLEPRLGGCEEGRARLSASLLLSWGCLSRRGSGEGPRPRAVVGGGGASEVWLARRGGCAAGGTESAGEDRSHG